MEPLGPRLHRQMHGAALPRQQPLDHVADCRRRDLTGNLPTDERTVAGLSSRASLRTGRKSCPRTCAAFRTLNVGIWGWGCDLYCVQPSTLKPAGPGRREIDWSSKFVSGPCKRERGKRKQKRSSPKRITRGKRGGVGAVIPTLSRDTVL